LFLNNIKDFLRIEPAAKSLKDTRDGTTSVVNISLPSERILAWNRAQTGLSSTKPVAKKETIAENGEEKTNGEKEKEPEEDMEKLVEETQFLEEEQLGGSVFAALKAAREKGMLMENEAEVAGI
jgi:U4/U6.U5 tri-snRNP-associated protein 1